VIIPCYFVQNSEYDSLTELKLCLSIQFQLTETVTVSFSYVKCEFQLCKILIKSMDVGADLCCIIF
jgi:hypothetical protein